MITQTFDLNLIPDSAPVVVHCDQYDKGTGRLVISLYDGSIAYSPNGTAAIQGTKPDGHGFDYACTMSGNVVTADLTEQMTAVAGQVRTQIVVTESTGRTGTFVFILDVQRSALPANSDMSESDYQIVEQMIEEVEEAIADMEGYVEDAEAWAVGERGGVPVTSGDETYQNNAEYYANLAAQYAQGGLHYKGSCTFANIPITGMDDGDMWNIEDDFTTDSRFREGAGVSVVAGTNIAWISSISKWDVLAVSKSGVQSFNGRTGIVTPQSGDYDLTDMGDVNISSATDGQGLVFDSVSGKWVNGNVAVSEMTNSTKGIGKPDGITTEASSGVFSAKGVGIVADVNPNGTAYGNDWLYYSSTTTVITPDADSMYRVIVDNKASLYYWDGTNYVQLASAGGSGGTGNLVDVTTAQYNALTPAEKADPDTWYWINDMDGLSGSAIVIGTFAGLTDTSFSDLQNGQIPVYNSTTQKWENQNISIPSGDYYELYNGTNIASGTDLNTLTSVGTYTKRMQSFKATNEPSDLTQYHRYNLIVQLANNEKITTANAPIMQILYAHTHLTGEISVYVRGFTSSSGWSDWKNISDGGGSVTSFYRETSKVTNFSGHTISANSEEGVRYLIYDLTDSDNIKWHPIEASLNKITINGTLTYLPDIISIKLTVDVSNYIDVRIKNLTSSEITVSELYVNFLYVPKDRLLSSLP